MVSSNFPNRPFRLEENCWTRYQDVGGNFSNIGGELWIRKNAYSPSRSGYKSSFAFAINGGQVAGWDFTFDFINSDALRLAYVEVNVGHNADGTKTVPIDAWCNADVLGYTSLHSDMTQPTIPRASTATFPYGNWADAGQTFYVLNNRASGSFTHDTDWYFGNANGRAGTGTGHDWNWTVPMSLLDQIPDSVQGVGKIRTHTYNGGNMIGWTETAFGITVPGNIVPTWTSTKVEETNAAVPAVLGSTGVYLQSQSILKSTIVGAAGVYSSRITSQSHTLGTETVSGAEGTFSQPVRTAGTQVPIVQTITDSRGRQKQATTNINVLPYARPTISSFTVDRVNSSNQSDPVGTRLRINLTGLVQSIFNAGAERNRLTLRVSTKPRNNANWSTPTNIVVDSTTLLYTGSYVLTDTFLVSNSYDVKVELIDKFSNTTAQNILTTGEVFMHWAQGLGVAKYWERGAVDVKGAIYSDDLTVPAGPVKGLLDPAYQGPGPARVYLLPDMTTLSTVAYEWVGKFERWGNRTVDMIKVGGTYKILGHSNDSMYGGKINLLPYKASNITTYNLGLNVNEYNDPRAQRLSSGIIVLSGMIVFTGAIGSGQVIFTLPAGYRPDSTMIVPVSFSGNPRNLSITPSGEVRLENSAGWSGGVNDWVTLDGIAFPAAGVATWSPITEWLNGWGQWNSGYPTGYWKDPYGVVWLRGLVSGGTQGADIGMFRLPATHSAHKQTHNLGGSNPGFGYVSAFPASHQTLPRAVVTKGGNPNFTWLSLSGVRIITPDALANIPWMSPIMSSGWTAEYGTNFPRFQVAQRPDGLGIAQGLVGVGTTGVTITSLQDWISPEKTSILPGVGADNFRRWDIRGLASVYGGGQRATLIPAGTHSGWSSFDGMAWMIGD